MKIIVISSLYDVNGGAGIMAHHLAHGLSAKNLLSISEQRVTH